MPLTIETITYTSASDTSSSDSVSSSSSTPPPSSKPTIVLTLSGIKRLRRDDDPQTYLHTLYQQYPRLFHLMPYNSCSFQKIGAEQQLILSYQGKGPVRALIRGILAQNGTILPAPSTIIISAIARQQAEQIREQLTLTISPSATKPRALYAPNTQGAQAIGHSLGGVERQTMDDKTYIMHTVWGSRRRISDIIAALAELAAYLSGGQSPRSESFNDIHGERVTVGSIFNPDAITVEEHLLSLSADERQLFMETHALQWGECVAWSLYLGQTDAHLRNIMFDRRTQRLFILDFDRCYSLRTGKYNNMANDYFTPISQRDIRSPLKPVDRLFDNWFCQHQENLSALGYLHTLIKLGVLPGIDSICKNTLFEVGYYSALHACAILTYDHFHTCFAKHVANPMLLDTMCNDFAARSQALQQQLFSLPAFIHRYQEYTTSFKQLLSLMQWEAQNPTPLDKSSFRLACQQAIISKCTELQAFDALLLNQLIEKPGTEAYSLWHRRAQLELTAIDELIAYVPCLFSETESTLKIEQLNKIKKSILETKAVIATISEEKTIPLIMTIEKFSKYSVPINAEMDNLSPIQFYDSIKAASENIQNFYEFFKDYFAFLNLLEHYQHPFLFQLSSQLLSAGKPYAIFFNYAIDRISKNELMSSTAYDLNKSKNLRHEIKNIKNYCMQLSNTIKILSKLSLISLLDYLLMRKTIIEKINYLDNIEIEYHCILGKYPENVVPSLNLVDEKLDQSALLGLQTVAARKLLLSHIMNMASAFTDLVQSHSSSVKRQHMARLLNLCPKGQGTALIVGIVMQISRLIAAIHDNVTLPYYPASLTQTATDPFATKMEDLSSYHQWYMTRQETIDTDIRQLEQLNAITKQLHDCYLISPETKEQLHAQITGLLEYRKTLIDQYRHQQTQASAHYLSTFKTIYDTIAITWKPQFRLSLFSTEPTSHTSRPTTLEEQHQIYQRYILGTLNAWTAWVGIHALGRQATQVTGTRRLLRDAGAQTYYESFPLAPEIPWQRAASPATSSSSTPQPPSPFP